MNDEGKEVPLGFISRPFTKAEVNYSITEQEALAVIYALKKFRSIIYGYPVEIITDHRALIYMFTNKNLVGRCERWHLFLSDFNPEFTFRAGKLNIVPDYI